MKGKEEEQYKTVVPGTGATAGGKVGAPDDGLAPLVYVRI